MCQSALEGGKRCRSCTTSIRRGKDRAAYKAKKLSTAGAVSTPSISEMELARAGVRLEDSFDASVSLAGNNDFLLRLSKVRRDIKSFQGRDESILIKDLEEEVRGIGAIIDSRARILSGIDASEIALVKKELDQLIIIARKKAKAKLRREAKMQGSQVLSETKSLSEAKSVSTSVDIINQTVQSESEVVRVIRERLFTLESGATKEVLNLIDSLRRGYLTALGEARLMGIGFIPDNWVKTLSGQHGDLILGLSSREVIKYAQNSILVLPMLERQFVNRRGSSNSKDKESGQLRLEPYGVGESVVEGYFIDRYIGKVPTSGGNDWEVLSCGVEALSGQRLHLGGLVGVASGRSRHDDDLRQFVLGLLAVLES